MLNSLLNLLRILSFGFLCGCVGLGDTTSSAPSAPAAHSAPPNIILIISDDQGYPDYGFMGNKDVKTPHLDRIAGQSLLYTRGYVMPLCSPSLACLLTGQFPSRNGVTGNDLAPSAIPPGNGKKRDPLAHQLMSNSLLLPKALTDAGYLTLQTGKLWNMTYQDAGFTHGMTDTAGRHGDAGLTIGRTGIKPLTDFIETAVAAEKPFFLWYAPMMPHQPHNSPERLLSHYKGKGFTKEAEDYYAMVEWFDETCGELDNYLIKNKLADNTVILYLADNGWDASYALTRNRSKLSPYELGIRTPMFVRWPGHVKPQRDDDTLASIVDFAPTILKLAGAKAPLDLVGLDLLDRDAMTARKTVIVESYTHDIVDLKDPSKSLTAKVVINGWSKLLLPGPAKPSKKFSSAPSVPELFDLKTDPHETKNLAKENPAEVKRLQALMPVIGPK